MLLGESDVCEICFEEEVDDDDLLVFCDGCGVCVHALCYGISETLSEDVPWYCEVCSYFLARNPLPQVEQPGEFPLRGNSSLPRCCLCHNSLPLASQQISRTNLFAHVMCFRFAPLLEFEFFQRLSAGESDEQAIENIARNMSECKCDLCGLPGNIRDCSIEECERAFHPSCCVFAAGQLFIKETETTEFLQLLCTEHAGDAIVQTSIWNGFERILSHDLNFPIDFDPNGIGTQIATLRTIESEKTFKQTLEVFGGNAIAEYDRQLSLEQEAMLEAQQVWQYVTPHIVHDPIAVGPALFDSLSFEP